MDIEEPRRLGTAVLDELLTDAVADGVVPQVVAIVADASGVLYERAVGPRSVGSEDPVSGASRFSVMSMTKMVTTTAALQLIEQGRLDLDTPVDEYCPQFAAIEVLEGFDGDRPVLRTPFARATVRHLLTHTSGFAYWFWDERIRRWEELTGAPNVGTGTKAALMAPLVSDPGTTFSYGISTDWLGLVVEVVAGTSLGDYVRTNITAPLGMAHTGFSITANERDELVPIHVGDQVRGWHPLDPADYPNPEYDNGGSGLYSTPRDYMTFQRMLLGRGEVDGVRVLRAETVSEAFSNQIGTLAVPEWISTADPNASCDVQLGQNRTWGYGLLMNTDHEPGMRSAWSGGWVGLANCYYWIDPAAGLAGALYAQRMPFGVPDMISLFTGFERQVYSAFRGETA